LEADRFTSGRILYAKLPKGLAGDFGYLIGVASSSCRKKRRLEFKTKGTADSIVTAYFPPGTFSAELVCEISGKEFQRADSQMRARSVREIFRLLLPCTYSE